MIACKGTKPACGSLFDYKTKKHVNAAGLPDKIQSYCSLDARELTASGQLDDLLWNRVCENIFSELTYGQSGPEEPRWQEAELIAGLVQFDLAKALEEATALLPDPKAWEALARAEATPPRAESGLRIESGVDFTLETPLRRRKGGRAFRQ